MKDLSARQQRTPGYIRDFFEDHDYPIRQIQNPSDINSTSVVPRYTLATPGRDRRVTSSIFRVQTTRPGTSNHHRFKPNSNLTLFTAPHER